MSIRIQHDLDRIEKFAKKVDGELPAALARGALKLATFAAGELADQVRLKLAKRPTGSLARSFEARLVTVSKTLVAAEAASRSRYARVHDVGGIIRPRTRKMLAIPHPMARIPRGKWPRDYPKGKLIRIGRLLVEPMVKKVGRGREGPALLVGHKPMFILVPFVRIKPTNYVKAAHDALVAKIPEILDPEIAKVLDLASLSTGGGHA